MTEVDQLRILVSEIGNFRRSRAPAPLDRVAHDALFGLEQYFRRVDLFHAGRSDVVTMTVIAAHLHQLAARQSVALRKARRQHRIVPAFVAVRRFRCGRPSLAAMTRCASELLKRMLVHVGEIRMRHQRLAESRGQYGSPIVTEMTGDASIHDINLRNPDLLDPNLETVGLLYPGILLKIVAKGLLNRPPRRKNLAPQCDRD